MKVDVEGFCYPGIDETKCVSCGLCVRVCPALNQHGMRTPLAVYAAKVKDEKLRLESSSGGMFSLFARKILNEGGRVYGAAFEQSDWSVRHVGVGDEAGLAELRGSKYLQSCTKGIYRQVKRDLERGLQVLFSGTPCQVSALKQFLGQDSERLFLIDVVCHGVPSPLVWKNYLKFQIVEHTGEGDGCKNIRSVDFRSKYIGWKRFSLSLRFSNGKVYRNDFHDDPFGRAFLSELCNRPSCHNCQFRELRSGSDLTIGDFWGVDKFHPEMDDDRGTSLVVLNTRKGQDLFEQTRLEFECVSATWAEVLRDNDALVNSVRPHRNRNRFLRDCSPNEFDRLVLRMLRLPFAVQARRCLSMALRKIGLR